MLKGIPTRIGSDLLKALADMGVGEEIFIKVCVVVSKIITWNQHGTPRLS